LFGSLEYEAVMHKDKNVEITIDWEDSEVPTVLDASQVWSLIFEGGQKWILSGNGTIFRYDFEGIIPTLLATWYKERKAMQRKKVLFSKLLSGVPLNPDK